MKPNLKNLTRDQKLQLIDNLEEIKRRKRESRDIYKPNEGQTRVHNSPAIVRLVTAGNGSGKTALGANEALWAAQGYNPVTEQFTPVPARIIVVLDSPSKVTDVWLPELNKWTNLKPDQLHKRGKPFVSAIQFDNGSEILFMFHEQAGLLFESIELDAAIFDEPPPRSLYVALRRGGRKKGRVAKFLIIGTPISAAWLRKDIYEPWVAGELPDTECFRYGTSVNSHNLADNYIEDYGRALSEKEKRIRFEGEFFDLEGLALSNLFDIDVHCIPRFEIPRNWPCIVAIDPHPSKAHHAVLVATDPDNRLYYVSELKLKLVAREYARELRKWYQPYTIVDITCDSLGSAQGTGGEGFKSFIQVLREEGVMARATSWSDKNDEDFISRIQDALVIPTEKDSFGQMLPKLRIFEGNRGIVSDIENVQWLKHRGIDEYKPKLDITNKDFLSALKYALAANPKFNKAKAPIYKRSAPVTAYGMKARSPYSKYFKPK